MPARRERLSLQTLLTRAVFGPLCLALSASLLALIAPDGLSASLGVAALWIAAAGWAFVQVQRCAWALEHPLAQATGALRAIASGQEFQLPTPNGVREMEPLTEAMADLREYLAVMVVTDDEAPAAAPANRSAMAPTAPGRCADRAVARPSIALTMRGHRPGVTRPA
jgi:hypothetical protein